MTPPGASDPAPVRPASGLPPRWRVPLLMLGFVGLVVGAGAGLARLGWQLPSVAASAAGLHGPLMVCGFFGVVISLERAVAIGRGWAYLGPILAGTGGAAAVSGAAGLAAWLFLGAGLVLLAASLDIFRRQRALFTLTLVLGAACWPIGTALWMSGFAVHEIAGWWLSFLILTIAGERLELSRFLPPSRFASLSFGAILATILLSLAGASQPWGMPLFGAALVALAGWLFRQDLARRTVRNQGLTRFIAVCLLSGYVWLAAGGLIIVAAGGLAPGSAAYGAAMHALALGFVFSMVFGHAPIIVPALLRVAVPYHPGFYLPLALLHLSMLVRLGADAAGAQALSRAGGLLHAVAILAFIAGTASAAARGALPDRGKR